MSSKTMNVSIQVLPLVEKAIPIVDRAIKVVQNSGVKYEVGPMETVLEGDDLDTLLDVAKAAHRECLKAGADSVVSFIKIAESTDGTTIEGKTGKYRKSAGDRRDREDLEAPGTPGNENVRSAE